MKKILKFILNLILFIPRLLLNSIAGLVKLIIILLIILAALAYYYSGSLTSVSLMFKNLFS